MQSTVVILAATTLTIAAQGENPVLPTEVIPARGFSNSPPVTIEVTPGRLSGFDNVVVSLLPLCPHGWRLVKDCHAFWPLTRPGFSLHLCRSHMRGEAVLLWFTKEEAKVHPDQQLRGNVELLGRARDLFVYASVGENTPPLWPTAIEEISGALQITKQ